MKSRNVKKSKSLEVETRTFAVQGRSLAVAVLMAASPRLNLFSLCFGVFVVLPSVAIAQSGNGYDLTWSTVDSGGFMFSTGDGYELGGTIGQPDAGVSGGGGYELSGGFWVPFGVGPMCLNATDCNFDPANNACNHTSCPGGSCTYSCVKFGDVQTPPNGIVNLDDILCLLAGFSSFSSCLNGDIHPCGGNGIINLDDILSVLNAFSGNNPCACTENTSPGTGVAPLCGSNQP